ncbi:RNA-binding domain-containing protein [Bacillus cereus]|uniref:RNA-binding domain-containing protein n=1 Tax=Bacillus cereus TaxID=1396 RepID=UPI0024BD1994|nr:RNA-binding domain-containing protein [Bacillus cereus]WLG16652.1 putative DNA binding domain-containing protein [Bacillus cereus]
MFIEKINLKNFGPFNEYTLNLKPEGLNLITGPANSGKTQLFGAFIYILYGKRAIGTSDTNSESTVTLITEHNKIKQIHEYNYSSKKILYYFQQQTILRSNSIDTSTLTQSHFHTLKASFIKLSLREEIDLSLKKIELMNNIIAYDSDLLLYWKKVTEKYIPDVTKNSGKILVTSKSLQNLLILLGLLLSEIQQNKKSPLILDESFPFLYDNILFTNPNNIKLIWICLNYIAKTRQVIIFTSTILNDEQKQEYNLNISSIADLSMYRGSMPSPNYYNNWFPSPSKKKEEKKSENSLEIIKYIKNNYLEQDEHRFIELKEVQGKNPISSIISIVDQYVVAYLNEFSKHPGMIIWGITDNEKKIVGVNLNYKQRDELRKQVSEKIAKIEPSIPPSSFKINLVKVYNNKMEEIPDLYVVEVLVEPYINDNFLFCTSKNEVYIKTDGGKRKLTPVEIQKEVLKRKTTKQT